MKRFILLVLACVGGVLVFRRLRGDAVPAETRSAEADSTFVSSGVAAAGPPRRAPDAGEPAPGPTL